MIIKDNKELGFIYKNNENIDKIYKNNELIFEQGFTREQAGNVPLTTEHQTIGKDLKDYKIYGNSVQARLPNEYQEVEYIESTGTQYIDTGRPITSNLKMTLDFEMVGLIQDSYCFGHYNSDNGEFYIYKTGRAPINLAFGCRYGDANLTLSTTRYRLTFYINNGQTFIINNLDNNNVIFQKSALNSLPSANIIIAGSSMADYTSPSKTYEALFYENDVLVSRLIPCYRKSDNVIGMYDLVGNVFYTNAGTGTFLKGNNIPSQSTPLLIESVGDPINYSNIPEEYQEVEYIESTGTQYIDTGLTPTNDTGAYIDSQYTISTGGSSSSGAILGALTLNVARFIPITINPTYGYRAFIGIGAEETLTLSSTTDLNRHTLEFNISSRDVKFDGVSKGTVGTIGSANISIYIFARHYSGSADLKASAKLYSLKLYESGVLTRDFIPCYRKLDNEIGMYDLVNNVFYTNSGTGTFKKGNDKVKYKIPIQTIPELRSEYQQVEYIESTGTQYIDTNFIPNQNTSVEIKAKAKSSTFIFGSRKSLSENSYGIAVLKEAFRSDYGNENLNFTKYLNVITLKKDKNKIYCNNVYVMENNIQTFTCPGNLFLFGVNNNGSVLYGQHEIYFCKIYDNGILIRNLIPCYRKSDNEIGMYDTVNDVFYTNSGTGTFLKGNDIYEDNNTEYIYLDEPLRKVGTFADYLDYKNQKLYRNVIVNDDSGEQTIENSYSGTIDTTGTDITLPPLPTKKNDVTTLSVHTKIKPTAYIKYKGH